MSRPLEPRVVREADGWSHTWGLDRTVVKVSAEDSGGWFTLVEDNLQADWSLGSHHHAFHAELFYILDGTVRFVVDGMDVEATAGTTVYVPPDVVHEARADTNARMLMFYTPGGFDRQLAKWADDASRVVRPLEEAAFDLFEESLGPGKVSAR